ncbi:MAG: DUF1732 domain-containing protein [Nannocystaceae bacterium]|nr:DUF1732 domain-containing protein [Nannocystaceae bacterium]
MSVVSMTGYGAASRAWDVPGRGRVRVDVEARSVNGRFLEIKLRQPFGAPLEPKFRLVVERYVGRGRVEVSVFVRRDAAAAEESDPLAGLGVDPQKVAMVAAAAAETSRIAMEAGLEVLAPTSLEVLRFCTGMKSASADERPEVPPFVEALIDDALRELAGFRATEGSALETTLRELATQLAGATRTLTELLPPEAERVQARVAARLAELIARAGAPVLDESRVAQEVAVVLARGDVAEELARIDSHLGQMTSALDAPPSVGQGKTLDFLTQELHREFTTMGSKLTSHEGSRIVIEGKAIIERIREQVQNVE